MKYKKAAFRMAGLMFVFFMPMMSADAQILNQDLQKEYENEKKELSSQQAPAQNQSSAPAPQTAAANDGDGIEIGGPPPRENFSTLSQQDAGIILEAAKSLETENPELAKKLLDIGK